MEYIDNTVRQEENDTLRKYAFLKFKKQNKNVGIFLILLLLLYMIKIFFTNPDIMTCDKIKGKCLIERKAFYTSQYTVEKEFNLKDIKAIYYRSFTRRIFVGDNIHVYLNDGTSFYVYDYFTFSSFWNVREQYNKFKGFLKSNQQKIILKEHLDKSGSLLILIILIGFVYYVSCLPPRKRK